MSYLSPDKFLHKFFVVRAVKFLKENYELLQLKHNWRGDSIEYKKWQNLFFRIRANKSTYSWLNNAPFFGIIKKRIYGIPRAKLDKF